MSISIPVGCKYYSGSDVIIFYIASDGASDFYHYFLGCGVIFFELWCNFSLAVM